MNPVLPVRPSTVTIPVILVPITFFWVCAETGVLGVSQHSQVPLEVTLSTPCLNAESMRAVGEGAPDAPSPQTGKPFLSLRPFLILVYSALSETDSDCRLALHPWQLPMEDYQSMLSFPYN